MDYFSNDKKETKGVKCKFTLINKKCTFPFWIRVMFKKQKITFLVLDLKKQQKQQQQTKKTNQQKTKQKKKKNKKRKNKKKKKNAWSSLHWTFRNKTRKTRVLNPFRSRDKAY